MGRGKPTKPSRSNAWQRLRSSRGRTSTEPLQTDKIEQPQLITSKTSDVPNTCKRGSSHLDHSDEHSSSDSEMRQLPRQQFGDTPRPKPKGTQKPVIIQKERRPTLTLAQPQASADNRPPGPSKPKPYKVVVDFPKSNKDNPGRTLMSPERDPLFIDASDIPDEDEYEEEIVYIDLDEVPNVQELFSVIPDDHLLLQNRRDREKPVMPKPTMADVTLKFYNLESEKPVLRLGKTFFTGQWLDSVGSSLFFKANDKATINQKAKQFAFVPLTSEPKENNLNNLIPEKPKSVLDEIVPDPVFSEGANSSHSFDLVANVKKVLKLTRRDLSCTEYSASARVIHDDDRFIPSHYMDKDIRNKVELLQILGKPLPEISKDKWALSKGPESKTEVHRRNTEKDENWEDISDSDLSADEGSSSSCDEIDEEAYEAYLKIREEAAYATKNFNSKNKKGKAPQTEVSHAFKERYSAPYYLNNRPVVHRLNSMLSSVNCKKLKQMGAKKPSTGSNLSSKSGTSLKPRLDYSNIRRPKRKSEQRLHVHETTYFAAPRINKDNPQPSLKSTTTRLELPDHLKRLMEGVTLDGDGSAVTESEPKSIVSLENMEKSKPL